MKSSRSSLARRSPSRGLGDVYKRQHQDEVVAQQPGEALALRGRQGRPVEAAVIGDALVEGHRREVARAHLAALAHADRGGVVHVGVEHGDGLGQQAVDRGVDAERGGLDRVPARAMQRAVMPGDHHVARARLGPEIALGIDEHEVGPAGHRDGEMVAHAALVAEARRPSQRRRELDPRLPQPLVVLQHRPPRPSSRLARAEDPSSTAAAPQAPCALDVHGGGRGRFAIASRRPPCPA